MKHIEAMKQALEALDGLVKKTSGQAIYSFMETERRIAIQASVGRSQTQGEKHMKHDHRQSLWIIAGGQLLWCYRCGAWRPNVSGRMQWHKPTGPNGINTAIKEAAHRIGKENT